MESEPPAPKWGDPVETIPAARRAALRQLHDAQARWAADDSRDPAQSPCASAGTLTGAEVYFLALYTLAGAADDLAR